MSNRMLPLVLIGGLAAVLWVVPSIGSHGMGTLGERFAHADRGLVEVGGSPDRVTASLRDADVRVERALPR